MTGPPPTPPAGGRGVRAALGETGIALAGVSDTPRLDAELLMAHALGIAREALLLKHLDDPVPAGFAPLVARRVAREPIAYITGRRAFWTIELAVGPGVLIPRPDSETLIEAAVEHFGDKSPGTVLDLGTGPGTLLLAALAEWPRARGLGVDASQDALDFAEHNAIVLDMAERVRFARGDWAAGVGGRFDLILCNPPYIGTNEPLPADVRDHEPGGALFAGPDGLDDYRRIAPELPALLAPGGAAILEIGHTQAAAVTALLEAEGFAVALKHDLGGRPRALVAT